MRDVASCKISAGLVPCNLVTFHLAKNEVEFYDHVEKLVKFVQGKCNKEWKVHTNALLSRLKMAITCPGGYPDHTYTHKKCGPNAYATPTGGYGDKRCVCKDGFTGDANKG